MAPLAPEVSASTLQAVLGIFLRNRHSDAALRVFQRMRDEHVPLSVVHYTQLMRVLLSRTGDAASRTAPLRRARDVFAQMREDGIAADSECVTVLVDALIAGGHMGEAQTLLQQIDAPDSRSYAMWIRLLRHRRDFDAVLLLHQRAMMKPALLAPPYFAQFIAAAQEAYLRATQAILRLTVQDPWKRWEPFELAAAGPLDRVIGPHVRGADSADAATGRSHEPDPDERAARTQAARRVETVEGHAEAVAEAVAEAEELEEQAPPLPLHARQQLASAGSDAEPFDDAAAQTLDELRRRCAEAQAEAGRVLGLLRASRALATAPGDAHVSARLAIFERLLRIAALRSDTDGAINLWCGAALLLRPRRGCCSARRWQRR